MHKTEVVNYLQIPEKKGQHTTKLKWNGETSKMHMLNQQLGAKEYGNYKPVSLLGQMALAKQASCRAF